MDQGVRSARLDPALERISALELLAVTERAAVAAARLRGQGDEMAADRAAAAAMGRELSRLPIQGTVVVGDGEPGESPMLFIGEEVGAGFGPTVDVAVAPLDGATLCAKDLPNAIAVVVIADAGTLLRAPDIYMDKIAVGPGYREGLVDLDSTPGDNVRALAEAKGVAVKEITVCVLDRPRHARLIADLRDAGASVRLISGGDVAGIIDVTDPEQSGIDLYLGSGGAAQGVLAAAALRCVGGQMQGRLVITSDEHRQRARRMNVADFGRKYSLSDMVRGDVLFAATGVTGGNLLSAVRFSVRAIVTRTVVLRSWLPTVLWVESDHLDPSSLEDVS